MGYYDDYTSAETRVKELETLLSDAKALLQKLLGEFVKGGPDVSQFQGDIDWTKVRGAGYELSFVKVSDGDILDPTYTSARLAAMRTAGLLVSPYYFARVASAGNSERTGRIEAGMAIHFAFRQGWGKGDLPLVYDFETLNGQTADKAAKQVVDFTRTYKYIMGHMPIIYTTPSFWESISASLSQTDVDNFISPCPLWIAHWGVTKPTIPKPWTDWSFWQYTDKGSVPGITNACDLNSCNLTKTQLNALRLT